MKRCFFVLSLFFASFSLSLSQNSEYIVPGENLITDGIPAIPSSVAAELEKYTQSKSAIFCDWHPLKKEMIMSTRFGNTSQLSNLTYPLEKAQPITFFDEPVRNASYEPVKGEYFLFYKDIGGDEFRQIYRYDIADGKVTMLTKGGREQNGSIEWIKGSDKIAYTSTRRNGADRDIYIMNPGLPESDSLFLELKGGGWGIIDCSADGKYLLLMEFISSTVSHYHIADLTTGDLTPLTSRNSEDIYYGNAVFSTDGKGLYFITDKDHEFKTLAYMDLSDNSVRFISENTAGDAEGMRLSPDGKHLAYTVNESGQSVLYILNIASDISKRIDKLPVGLYSSLSFHNNSEDLAVSVSSARSSRDIYVYNLNSNDVTVWTESDMGGLIPEELSIPELIKWNSFDGLEISGFYYKPSAKFEGKRPVIIDVHGGPEGQSRPGFIGSMNYYLNELGIAVIFPNVRGSTGFGKNFIKLDNGFNRKNSVKDIGALLDWVALQPDLDAERVMVMGGSYGGYMALAVSVDYADRIRCAVDVVGISNFNTFLKNTESYRTDLRRVEYGDERDPEIYEFLEKISPLNNAEKITKPILIVQGGNDPRVPRTEAEQMMKTIKSIGGTVWYLEAKDEGHGFAKKSNADFQRYVTVMFVRKYLLGES
ncbi:MAG: S9 family peptidase [Ignavibacteria bacterium]|nr:S9 family peptidase [Ignavibacteria bacterium]